MSLILSGTDGLSDVDGSAATPAIRGTDANTGIFFPAADTIAFSEGGVEAMRIDSSGNVGIGTNSPAYKLDVAATTAVVQMDSSSGIAGAAVNRYKASNRTWVNGVNVIDNSGAYTIYDVTASAERMRVDSSGNVGIGTNSPGAKFEVRSGRSWFQANSEPYALYVAYNSSTNGFFVGSPSADALSFSTAGGSERMRIDSSGNLLVGTTTANATGITVTKSAAGSAGVILGQNTQNVNGDWTYRSILGSNCNTGASVHFAGTTTGGGTWYLLGNGTSSWTSDVRLKKNIQTTRDGYLEDVCKLRVVKYQWNINSDDSPKELGLIAQEVEQVFPSLVQDQLAPSDDGETYKMIKGSVIPMLLLKAIQEQQALIQSLTIRLTALEQK